MRLAQTAFSPQQYRVFLADVAVEGKPDEVIARELGITASNVRTYRSAYIAKLRQAKARGELS